MYVCQSAILLEDNNCARTGYSLKKPFEYKNIFDWIINFLAMLKQTSYQACTVITSLRPGKKKERMPLKNYSL